MFLQDDFKDDRVMFKTYCCEESKFPKGESRWVRRRCRVVLKPALYGEEQGILRCHLAGEFCPQFDAYEGDRHEFQPGLHPE
jgi:hypothetical protein